MKKNCKRMLMAMTAVLMMAGVAGCGKENNGSGQQTGEVKEHTDQSAQAQTENTEKDSVIVVMGPSSEPEAGFDPVYGRGCGFCSSPGWTGRSCIHSGFLF